MNSSRASTAFKRVTNPSGSAFTPYGTSKAPHPPVESSGAIGKDLSLSPTRDFFIDTPAGPLAAVLHLPRQIPAPSVVCCHGLESSKDSEKFIAICEELCRAGLAALRFDFTGCGESRTSPDRHLLATRVRDLECVLAYTLVQPWCNGEAGLLGSSLGGYLALLAASTGRTPLRGVVTLAAPFDLERLQRRLREEGYQDELGAGGGRRGNSAEFERHAAHTRSDDSARRAGRERPPGGMPRKSIGGRGTRVGCSL